MDIDKVQTVFLSRLFEKPGWMTGATFRTASPAWPFFLGTDVVMTFAIDLLCSQNYFRLGFQ